MDAVRAEDGALRRLAPLVGAALMAPLSGLETSLPRVMADVSALVAGGYTRIFG